MRRRRLVTWLLVLGCTCTAALRAQSTLAPADCPLGPSHAEQKGPKIRIDKLEFEGTVHLADSVIKELLSKLDKEEFTEDWMGELDSLLRDAWQDRGYFTVFPTIAPDSLRLDPVSQTYSVRVHVEEGIQFFLGGVRFESAQPDQANLLFPNEVLRKQVPLERGDPFSAVKVRQALEGLHRLYSTQGYLDCTASPTTEIDQARQIVNLVIILDPGVQYRVRTLETIGVDRATEARLHSILRPGEILDTEKLHTLFKENEKQWPRDAWFHRLHFTRMPATESVDVRLDLRPCPATIAPPQP